MLWHKIQAAGSKTAWDLRFTSFVQSFSVGAQESAPSDLFFKPDGTKMYVVGNNGDEVNEYNLSTAWNISTASFLQLFSVAAQTTQPQGLSFKPDGTKMYVVGNLKVDEYNLSTAWNISTASYLQTFTFPIANPGGETLFFKPDGTRFYTTDLGGNLRQYSLTTAWNTSTASLDSVFSISLANTFFGGLFIKDNGKKMYVSQYGTSVNAPDYIYQYALTSPWDITSTVFVRRVQLGLNLEPTGVFFKPDGTRFYTIDDSNNSVMEYTTG